jgi:thiol-disulfide isomerase/thioredoxin/mono/diheme cytochrome c family protein
MFNRRIYTLALFVSAVCVAASWRQTTPAAESPALAAGESAKAAKIEQVVHADKPAGEVALGAKIDNVAFTDIRYLPRTLDELGERKATVIMFTTLDCPIVQRYLPKLRELEAAYRSKGVKFLALNVGPDDPLVEVAYQAVKTDLPFPVGKDYDAVVAKAVGATRTPEVVVLDAERRLRYRGRIDDSVRLTGVRPKATRDDLREALDEVLAGAEVKIPATPVDGCAIVVPKPSKPRNDLNYHEHIEALVQKHCQDCHRPGGQAPFELLTYQQIASRADTIAEVVRQGRMPPSFASRQHGEFTNERRMSDDDRNRMLAWLNSDRREGDVAKAPMPRQFVETKWAIGTPDLVIQAVRPTKIAASGYIPYKYEVLPFIFWHDTWVQQVQILPGNKKAVHHCNMGHVRIGANMTAESSFITGYVPGGEPMRLYNGVGLMIPAGSMLVLQLHYVTTGEETTDQTSVGIVFAKEPIDKVARHFQCSTSNFAIPPGASHHEVKAARTFAEDATGVGMFVHMHLRGTDMTYQAKYPDGRSDTLLCVPNYNFDWQLAYRWKEGAVKFPKGTRVECTAHYDNSTFNPFNPDPTKTVRHGQQTYDEMMFGFLFYTYDHEKLGLKINPKNGSVMK